MDRFSHHRATDAADALLRGKAIVPDVHAPAQFIAGGTTLVDLMKCGTATPLSLIDLSALKSELNYVHVGPEFTELGAFTSMADAAGHPEIVGQYPIVAQSLLQAASQQIRNMATLGGNILQRTRCPYYRDPTWPSCNKRQPGTGCGAIEGGHRNHAVLGVDSSCIAQYNGDLAVALVTLEAQARLVSSKGSRWVLVESIHRPATGQPDRETTLHPGEIIVALRIPRRAWYARSAYVKVRDRTSYEFALSSAAVALELEGDVVATARVGLGGGAYRPWRSRAAEDALIGHPLTTEVAEAAGRAAYKEASVRPQNAFKPELGARTVVRALMQARAARAG